MISARAEVPGWLTADGGCGDSTQSPCAASGDENSNAPAQQAGRLLVLRGRVKSLPVELLCSSSETGNRKQAVPSVHSRYATTALCCCEEQYSVDLLLSSAFLYSKCHFWGGSSRSGLCGVAACSEPNPVADFYRIRCSNRGRGSPSY